MLDIDCKTEELIDIRYSDIDFDKSIKPSSLLNFFQDIGSDNSEINGFGYSYLFPKNLMWVLLKYRIEFRDYPVNLKRVKLITEPRGCRKLFAYRNFELYNENKIIAMASSVWGLVDFKTMSMVNTEKVLFDVNSMGRFVPKENDLSYEKIPEISSVDYQEEFKVRYNDIDVNMHANNSNYIIWALEPLPCEFRKTHRLKNVDIVYKKEIKFGEKLISKSQIINENITVHCLQNLETGNDICLFRCEWN